MQHNKEHAEKQPERREKLPSLYMRLDNELRPKIFELQAQMQMESNHVVSMQKVISELVRKGLECYKSA